MPEIKGVDIREIWNHRLSRAVPCIDRRGGTWVAQIWAKSNPDFKPGDTPAVPLESFDTGVPAVVGDEHDREKICVCYDWLKSRREEYSLPNIEELKPLVAEIEVKNQELHALNAKLAGAL
jgi:hypothetical protein